MKFDPKVHHRRSIRLKGYDYAQAGGYFVTMVAFQRDEIFGEVAQGIIKLSPLGMILREEWLRSVNIRQEIRLYADEFVIMPNHLHGIVWIIEPPVGAEGVGHVNGAQGVHSPVQIEAHATAPQRAPKSLSSFVAGFKASVTGRARRELDVTGIWQRNYYEHIIRNEDDYRSIKEYILANPLRWSEDQLHPCSPPNQLNT